jgi:hypothetical protein
MKMSRDLKVKLFGKVVNDAASIHLKMCKTPNPTRYGRDRFVKSEYEKLSERFRAKMTLKTKILLEICKM